MSNCLGEIGIVPGTFLDAMTDGNFGFVGGLEDVADEGGMACHQRLAGHHFGAPLLPVGFQRQHITAATQGDRLGYAVMAMKGAGGHDCASQFKQFDNFDGGHESRSQPPPSPTPPTMGSGCVGTRGRELEGMASFIGSARLRA